MFEPLAMSNLEMSPIAIIYSMLEHLLFQAERSGTNGGPIYLKCL
jgi:hypothetical protein